MPSAAVIGSRLHELFSGVFALPLTVLRRVRGPPGDGLGRRALRREVRGPGRAWSGRAGGQPAGLRSQVQPGVFAVADRSQTIPSRIPQTLAVARSSLIASSPTGMSPSSSTGVKLAMLSSAR